MNTTFFILMLINISFLLMAMEESQFTEIKIKRKKSPSTMRINNNNAVVNVTKISSLNQNDKQLVRSDSTQQKPSKSLYHPGIDKALSQSVPNLRTNITPISPSISLSEPVRLANVPKTTKILHSDPSIITISDIKRLKEAIDTIKPLSFNDVLMKNPACLNATIPGSFLRKDQVVILYFLERLCTIPKLDYIQMWHEILRYSNYINEKYHVALLQIVRTKRNKQKNDRFRALLSNFEDTIRSQIIREERFIKKQDDALARLQRMEKREQLSKMNKIFHLIFLNSSNLPYVTQLEQERTALITARDSQMLTRAELQQKNAQLEAQEKSVKLFQKDGHRLLFRPSFYNEIEQQITPEIKEWIVKNISKDAYQKEWQELYDKFNVTPFVKESKILAQLSLHDKWHRIIDQAPKQKIAIDGQW